MMEAWPSVMEAWPSVMEAWPSVMEAWPYATFGGLAQTLEAWRVGGARDGSPPPLHGPGPGDGDARPRGRAA